MKAVFAFAAGILVVSAALAQSSTETLPQAAGPEMLALTSSSDATAARRMLMTSIGENNDILHEMLDGYPPWDEDEFRARLESMSAMMAAFPNLYRAAPNPWTAEQEAANPAVVSLSLPSIWERWDEFVVLSAQASDNMFEASLALRDDLLAEVEEVELKCDSCHAQFRQDTEIRSLDEYLAPPVR